MPVGPSYWLRCRSKRSISVWSVAVPMSETGWRCTTSASSAPRVMTSPVPDSSAMPAIWSVKVRQRSWRLGAEHEHDVAAGRRRGVRVVGRPRDAAGVAVDQADLGPGRLEVGELLGVDAGERLRAPLLDQVADGERRGVAGVVPAGEGGDHRRAAEGRAAAPDHVLHRSRRYRPSGPARRGPGRYGLPMILTSLVADADELAARTGWTAKPQGLCQGEVCVPAPGSIRDDGALDVEVVAQRLRMPLVHDEEHGLWALGPPAGGTALASAVAADPDLVDRDGNPFRLSSLHGRKVLLVAWASW